MTARAGPAGRRTDDRHGPERSCIVTRAKASPETLVRFVLAPDGSIAPDLKQRLPGRGVWVGLDRGLVETAVRRNLFARALRSATRADAGLPALVDRLLVEDLMGALGLARKAGQAVTGFDQVARAARKGAAAAVFHAADGAEDGLRKIAAAHAAGGGKNGVLLVRLLDAQQLGLALGGTNVIHAAVLAGRTGTTVVAKAHRLARYRGDDSTGAGRWQAGTGGRTDRPEPKNSPADTDRYERDDE